MANELDKNGKQLSLGDPVIIKGFVKNLLIGRHEPVTGRIQVVIVGGSGHGTDIDFAVDAKCVEMEEKKK